jgi:diguanylate cyclase (GGDEF)-like protein
MTRRLLAAARAGCVALLAAAPGVAAAAPEAFDGTVTVESLPASLSGTWEIAFDDPTNGVLGLDTLRFIPVRVPATWQADAASRPALDRHGVAWYRLRIELAPALAATPLAFATDQIRDSDEVYLDGVLVGRTGRFPPRYDKGTFMGRVYPLPANLTSRGGTHVLAVRVYNAGPRGGGITAAPVLDSVSGALWRRTMRDAPRALLAAAIGALGLFALFFFLRDRRQTDFLWFFVYTSLFTLYVATWLSAWIHTSVPLSLVFRVNFAEDFLLFLVFLLFFHRFFERPLEPRHKVIVAVHTAGALFCLLWPRVDDLYYALPVCYASITAGSLDILASLVHGARRRVPHARAVLAGCSIVFLAVLHDIAQDLGLFGPAGILRLLGPSFLVFAIIFLSVVADRVKRLRVAATTDPLTGLANRAVLFERIALELARARRASRAMTLAVLDLDHFKKFNDEFGHMAGDRLLIATAQALVDSIRDTDLAARYGGEEFVVVLCEATMADALICLERVRAAVAEARVSGAQGGTTASIGVAVYDPAMRPNVSVTALLRQADAALYQAKARGRDRIVVAEGAPPASSSSGILPQSSLLRRRSDGKGLRPVKRESGP